MPTQESVILTPTQKIEAFRAQIETLCVWLREHTLANGEGAVVLPNGILPRGDGSEEISQLLAAKFGGEIGSLSRARDFFEWREADYSEGLPAGRIDRSFALVGPRSRFLVDWDLLRTGEDYLFDLCDPEELTKVLELFGPVETWAVQPPQPTNTVLLMPKDYDENIDYPPVTAYDEHLFVARVEVSTNRLEDATGAVGSVVRHGGLFYGVTDVGEAQPIPTVQVQELMRWRDEEARVAKLKSRRSFVISVYHGKPGVEQGRIMQFDFRKYDKVAEVRVTNTPRAALYSAREMTRHRAVELGLAEVVMTAARAVHGIGQPVTEWMIPQGGGVSRLVSESYRFTDATSLVVEQEGDYYAYQCGPLEEGEGFHVLPDFHQVPTRSLVAGEYAAEHVHATTVP